LSIWTVLNGERALEFRELLVSAAEAGDFSEHTSDDGVRVNIAIQDADQASPNNKDGSPLARLIAGRDVDDDARAYDFVLPEIERLLKNVNAYESVWREGWENLEDAFESFAGGESEVTEYADSRISLVTLAPELYRGTVPFTAISKFARGELFLIAIPSRGGWLYRLDYPYYSWAETVVRPRIAPRDFTTALRLLNEREANRGGQWQTDHREM